MPIDRDNSGTPEADLPALAHALDSPEPGQVRGTLASRLVPVVDSIRSLNSKFGIRPYRVFMVHSQWTGGEPGVGYENITSRIEITPTPRIKDMDAVNTIMRETGLTEEGDVEVDQISARFTEDDLTGRTPDLNDPNLPRTTGAAFDFYWEVVENRGQSPNAVIRRFNPRNVPGLSRDGFQWKITLIKQDYDRGRRGEVDRSAF